jgi:hypothetical protein
MVTRALKFALLAGLVPALVAAPNVSAGATSPAGTWTVTITRAELRSAGATLQELSDPTQWGRYRAVTRRGRYRVVNLTAGFRWHGTYWVRGDVVHFRGSDGVVNAYHWSVYRNKMRLRKATSDSATWPTVKPWHRVS